MSVKATRYLWLLGLAVVVALTPEGLAPLRVTGGGGELLAFSPEVQASDGDDWSSSQYLVTASPERAAALVAQFGLAQVALVPPAGVVVWCSPARARRLAAEWGVRGVLALEPAHKVDAAAHLSDAALRAWRRPLATSRAARAARAVDSTAGARTAAPFSSLAPSFARDVLLEAAPGTAPSAGRRGGAMPPAAEGHAWDVQLFGHGQPGNGGGGSGGGDGAAALPTLADAEALASRWREALAAAASARRTSGNGSGGDSSGGGEVSVRLRAVGPRRLRLIVAWGGDGDGDEVGGSGAAAASADDDARLFEAVRAAVGWLAGQRNVHWLEPSAFGAVALNGAARQATQAGGASLGFEEPSGTPRDWRAMPVKMGAAAARRMAAMPAAAEAAEAAEGFPRRVLPSTGGGGSGGLPGLAGMGLDGRGEVASVGDTGMDHTACFFHDPSVNVSAFRVAANATGADLTPNHRKVILPADSARLLRDAMCYNRISGGLS